MFISDENMMLNAGYCIVTQWDSAAVRNYMYTIRESQ